MAKNTRLPSRIVQRVRREFFPEDYVAAIVLLVNWDTTDCAPGESSGRMRRAALNLAHGDAKLLKWAISVARSDFRDLLLYGEDEEPGAVRFHCVKCPPYPTELEPDERAFLAAIRADPTDNTARLVYADWLEDRGDPRAAYLRVLCEWLVCRHPSQETTLTARERELRTGLGRRWLAEVRGMQVRDERKKAKRANRA